MRQCWVERAAAPGALSGLWVLFYDGDIYGGSEDEYVVPLDAGRVGLARSMEERCNILERMGARFHGSLEEYKGKSTFCVLGSGSRMGRLGEWSRSGDLRWKWGKIERHRRFSVDCMPCTGLSPERLVQEDH